MEIINEAGPSHGGPGAGAGTGATPPGHVNGVTGAHTQAASASSQWPLFYDLTLTEASIAPSHLSGSQDLLARLDLSGSYDRSVRPYLNPKVFGATAAAAAPATDLDPAGQDTKGKGRAGDGIGVPATTIQVNGTTIQDPGLVDKPPNSVLTTAANITEKAKSIKKHYSHMIIDVPGQNKLAKDHHLRDLLLNPDGPDHVKILPFDLNALRDAFTLEVGLLPDFDTSIWRADAAEEKKKKKKRKQEDLAGVGAAASAPSPGPNLSGAGTSNVQPKKRKLEA